MKNISSELSTNSNGQYVQQEIENGYGDRMQQIMVCTAGINE